MIRIVLSGCGGFIMFGRFGIGWKDLRKCRASYSERVGHTRSLRVGNLSFGLIH